MLVILDYVAVNQEPNLGKLVVLTFGSTSPSIEAAKRLGLLLVLVSAYTNR